MDLYSFVMNLPPPEFEALTNACINRLTRLTGPTLTAGELHLCSKGERIRAIKSVRDRTGMNLKGCKDLVDKGYPRPDIKAIDGRSWNPIGVRNEQERQEEITTY